MREPKPVLHPAIEHFGEQLRASRFGHKMTRELYAYPNRRPKEKPRREDWPEEVWNDTAWMYRDEEHTEHSDVFLLAYRDAALTNFDLSMKYFSSLDQDDFEGALNHVLAKGRTFKPVQSLKPWDGVAGAYIMVFDEYRQFYIGQSNDIRSRIKKHWTHRKPFDRVLLEPGMTRSSRLTSCGLWIRPGSSLPAAPTPMPSKNELRRPQTSDTA